MTGLGPERVELPEILEHDARRVLALAVGRGRREFALAKLAGVRNQPGWIVRDGKVSPWRVEGFFSHEQRLYLYGPYLPGRFLQEELEAAGQASAADGQGAGAGPASAGCLAGLPVLSALTEALLALKAHGSLPEELQTDAVSFLEDGGVLFLPAPLMRELRALRSEAHRLVTYQGLNNPDLRGSPEQLSFGLGALLYRVLTGDYPFQASTEEELRDRIRHQKLPSLASGFPGLREETGQAILRALRRAEGPAPTLEQWSALLAEAGARGLYRPLENAEREALEAQGRAEASRADRAYRRRVFWQRHWKTVLIVFASVALAGGVGGSFLKNLLAPRLTRGFPPLKVVESYYGAMNSLDHALMEDCVTNKAGKETIREVVNLYVVSRVNLGYEGKSHIRSAEQWAAQGRPELTAPDSVYGVTNLEIRQENGEPEPVFLATYTKWFPTPGAGEEDSPPAAPLYESQNLRERLYLRRARRDWVIYRIERL